MMDAVSLECARKKIEASLIFIIITNIDKTSQWTFHVLISHYNS